MDGDVPFVSREGEEAIFSILRQPTNGAEDGRAEDGSQFFSDSGPRMETEGSNGAQTSKECDDDSQIDGPPPSGEVY